MTALSATDQDSWDAFLLSEPWTPFLQSYRMGEVYREVGQEPIRLCIESGGGIVAICFGHVVPAKRGRHLSIPYGPVIASALPIEQCRAALDELLKHLKLIAAERGCAFIRMSPFWPPGGNNAMGALGRELDCGRLGETTVIPSPMHLLAEHIWYLDLASATEASLFAGMRKTTRNLVRRAERDGVTVRASTDPNRDIDTFLKLHDETKARHKFTPYTDAFFRAQVKHFTTETAAGSRGSTSLTTSGSRLRAVGNAPHCTLYLAAFQNQVIAASIHMHFGGETSYHHGASASAFNKVPASYLLQWTAIKDAITRGDRIYNFWGISPLRGEDTRDETRDTSETMNTSKLKAQSSKLAAHPFAGVTLFKTGFGGQLLTLPHCVDIPLSKRYTLTRGIEFIRKWRRGF